MISSRQRETFASMGVPGRCWAVWSRVGRRSWGVLGGVSLVLASSCAAGGHAVPPTTRIATSSSAAPRTPLAQAAAEPAPPPQPAPVGDPCRVAEGFTKAAIARAQNFAAGVMERQLATGAYTGPNVALPIDSFEMTTWLSCVKTPGGAWAIVLGKALLTPRNEDDWIAEWVLDGEVMLAHVDALGVVTHAPIRTQSGGRNGTGPFDDKTVSANCCEWLFGGLEPIELFDFDGDGEPEVHVGASYGHEGVHERSDDLFTFKNGKVERYAPAAAYSFEAMKDETGDGIPDLLFSYGLSGGESCGSGFPADGSGMSFIAHALPNGAFSADDAVARAFARQGCPTKPVAIKDLNDVLCARLWGADSTKLELQVRARFVPWDCDAEMAGRPQKPKAKSEYELMLSATKTPVPFTLP